jgi:aldehyde dehydrogenase (NAD+)
MDSELGIGDIVARQRAFFASGATRPYDARIDALTRLRAAIGRHEAALHAALKQDLGKPEFEAFSAETGFCRHELSDTIRQLKRWMKPQRVRTSILVQPGTSTIRYEPLGVNLIIAPFNYPVMLAFSPLTAAIAAGNTAVVKTSELTPACSDAIKQVIDETFDPAYVACVTGGVQETTALLAQRFDHIFFTGSTRVGTIVMRSAAEHLTPVTLELGGKSPCIVHRDANLEVAANRIVAGKFANAGQTCIAPDYLLVHREIGDRFLEALKRRITACFGNDPAQSPDFGRMVNDGHFARVARMIQPDKVVIGGETDAARRYIAPTVLKGVTLDDPSMEEEIFGPVLPVMDYTELSQVYDTVARLPRHPLACYVFSESGEVQREIMETIQFGGGCVNNCILHVVNPHLPFGGVGTSGIGAYHGFHGFEQFSHKKGILKTPTLLDIPLLYAPYGDKIRWLRRVMK